MITSSKRVLALAGTAIAIAVPAAASAAPPAERGGSNQAIAVRACVEYRQLIGHDTFRAAFGNLRGCVEMVVPTTTG